MPNIIYCDNAATSYPKPPAVYDAVLDFMKNVGGSPGRSSHALAVKASRVVFDAREACSRLFNVTDSSRIIFTRGATESINLALFGLLRDGDRVVVTALEHNSVMRPLRHLSRTKGIRVDVVPCSAQGLIDLDAFERTMKTGAGLAIINHASNVCGTIQPIEHLGAVARANGALFMVDAAQTAGALPIDVRAMGIDLMAFSGHKSLFGPQGVGGLFIREGITCTPLIFGGTGSGSDSDEQPDFMPDKFESGTLNGPGIAGLAAGIDFITKTGIDAIQEHGKELTGRFLAQLANDSDVITVLGPKDPTAMLPTISLSMSGADAGEVARKLNDEFGLCLRVGLHCAPQAHRTLGTFPKGTLRLSFGYLNTIEEIDRIVVALRLVCGRSGKHI
jgi:cysteine desulfurase / selenocysteine lyase